MMTRAEHMQWAKDRAFGFLDDGDAINALASFRVDIAKHPGTSDLLGNLFCTVRGLQILRTGGGVFEMRKFIEDFT